MKRSVFSALVAAAALVLGLVAIARGDYWLGVTLAAIAVLRISMLSRPRKPKAPPEPEIRLNLEEPPSVEEDGTR
jgi:hypothetical protein